MGKALLAAGVCAVASVVVSACLTRPVVDTEPHTSNLNIDQIRNEVVDKIDLLFMIDNSRSMGDKQALLAQAVPKLMGRLVVPRCLSSTGEARERTSLDETCPPGFAPEFRAVSDIHVAVISSSLGAHGASKPACEDTPPGNDRALFMPKVRNLALADYNGSGFLAWDPQQKLTPPGEKDAKKLGLQFGEMVKAAGELGCGFEASLESWYRFLIDPEPPLQITVQNERSVASGIDEEVLAQRRAFLRPDSLVAIVMLTDENDCSIRDDGSGFMLGSLTSGEVITRATSVCDKDPNDRCCLPCTLASDPPEGCTPPSSDAACLTGKYLTKAEDPVNLRCLRNKQRYGYDFLYPTSRYIQALTEVQVPRRSDGQLVENPLFRAEAGKAPRSPALVYLAGIVGVPWQDIADDASRSGAGLHYLSASELESSGRWNVIVGDASKNQPPSDPFMLESTKPRLGTNPVTGDVTASATALDPHASPINGHEQVDVNGSDLQYACTFALGEAKPCVDEDSCDCPSTDPGNNRPLCQPPGGGPAGATQYFGKAYPGLRPLEVLRGIGDSAIVASICPKVLDSQQPGYGYEPAVDAIIDRLKVALNARCLPRPLAVEGGAEGKLPCVVVEAVPPAQGDAGTCNCEALPRRAPSSGAAQDLVRRQLAASRECDTATTPPCSAFCMCELAQAEGQGLNECLNNEVGSDTPGYCYVNPYGNPAQGDPKLVAGCEDGKRQLIRFVGPNTPTPGASTFIACMGATLH
jgi:hypothetical protein